MVRVRVRVRVRTFCFLRLVEVDSGKPTTSVQLSNTSSSVNTIDKPTSGISNETVATAEVEAFVAQNESTQNLEPQESGNNGDFYSQSEKPQQKHKMKKRRPFAQQDESQEEIDDADYVRVTRK